MIKHYTEGELQAQLKELKIIIDRREKVNDHIVKLFEQKGIQIIDRNLDVGDYACQLGDKTFEHDFAIERKANLDEICGNLTTDRDRFEREFLRARAHGNTKLFLLIENSSWEDILSHNYQSKFKPLSLIASLLSWQVRFNLTIIMCKKETSAKIIYDTLYYAAREVMLYGDR